MPKFDVTIGLTIKAPSRAEAAMHAVGAAEHLKKTFNDDGRIKSAGVRHDHIGLLKRCEPFLAGYHMRDVGTLLADLRAALA